MERSDAERIGRELQAHALDEKMWETSAMPSLADCASAALFWYMEARSERSARENLDSALRQKDTAMGVLFDRLHKHRIDTTDLIP